MSDEMHHDLSQVISDREFTPHFQPIFGINPGQIIGYESFLRGPENSIYFDPDILTKAAINQGLQLQLELSYWYSSFVAYLDMQLSGLLFLNIHSQTLLNFESIFDVFSDLINRTDINSESVVLQFPNPYEFGGYQKIRPAIDSIKATNLSICTHWSGSAMGRLGTWVGSQPEFVKLSKISVEGIERSFSKKAAVQSITALAETINCKVIATGIETQNELNVLENCGVKAIQGTVAAPISEIPDKFLPGFLQADKSVADNPAQNQRSDAESMISPVTPISPSMSTENVADLFHKDTLLATIPVTERGNPIGIVTRKEIQDLFSGRYFRDLHGRKPIKEFMCSSFVAVETFESIEQVSKKVTNDPDQDLSKDFVITRQGQYAGMGKVRTLLKRITELEISTARYANPLTLLPGNVPLDESINRKLLAKESFWVAYFDINNFKPFNDVYGYSAGDEVIITLANILKSNTDSEKDIVGHIGGDDFVVIFTSNDWQMKSKKILEQFNSSVLKLYSFEDLNNSGIYAENRKGEKEFFGFVSVSAGVVNPDTDHCRSSHDVSNLAAQAKKEAKKSKESQLFISKRRKPHVSQSADTELTS